MQTTDGIYIKDLSVITSHDPSQMLLVDNSVHSFGLHLDNGIPIMPFYADLSDQELKHLLGYVKMLAQEADMV